MRVNYTKKEIFLQKHSWNKKNKYTTPEWDKMLKSYLDKLEKKAIPIKTYLIKKPIWALVEEENQERNKISKTQVKIFV